MSANTVCWADIPVTDLKRAIAFYSAVLGEKVAHESVPGFEFGLLPHKENNAAGCLVVSGPDEISQKGPLVYLSVEGRMDAAITAAKSNGGRVLQEKHQIGPHGYKAVLVNSEGNRIALHSHTA